MLIVISHMQGVMGVPADFMQPFNFCQAVSFFFVLSGFVLKWAYPEIGSRKTRAFLLARLGRIWPAHLLATALVLILLTSDQRPYSWSSSWWMLPSNILMIHAWIPYRACAYHYNTVSWSVSTEVFFYLSFPLLVHRWSQTWWLKLLLAAGLTVGMIVLCNVVPVSDGAEALEHGVSAHTLIYNHPLTRLFEFVLGMAMASLFRFLRPWFAPGWLAATAMELGVLGGGIVVMYYSGRMASGFQAMFPAAGVPSVLWLFAGGLCAPFFGLLLVVMALRRGLLSWLLARPVFVFLGEISYSVYLLHHVLLMYCLHHRELLGWMPPWLQLVIFLSVMLLISCLTWRYVEMPCRSWFRASETGAKEPGRACEAGSSQPL